MPNSDNTARLCYKLFEESGKIGYYELYKRLECKGKTD